MRGPLNTLQGLLFQVLGITPSPQQIEGVVTQLMPTIDYLQFLIQQNRTQLIDPSAFTITAGTRGMTLSGSMTAPGPNELWLVNRLSAFSNVDQDGQMSFSLGLISSASNTPDLILPCHGNAGALAYASTIVGQLSRPFSVYDGPPFIIDGRALETVGIFTDVNDSLIDTVIDVSMEFVSIRVS